LPAERQGLFLLGRNVLNSLGGILRDPPLLHAEPEKRA
jgi:hypothetical protein